MSEKKAYTDTLEELFNSAKSVEVPTAQPRDGGKFVVSYPKSFEDIRTIIDGLRSGCSALVNLSGIAKPLAQRMLDFISGASYALGGNIEKIQEGQYLLTSGGVTIKVNK